MVLETDVVVGVGELVAVKDTSVMVEGADILVTWLWSQARKRDAYG